MSQQVLAGQAPYRCASVDLDGANFLRTQSTFSTVATKALLSFWYNPDVFSGLIVHSGDTAGDNASLSVSVVDQGDGTHKLHIFGSQGTTAKLLADTAAYANDSGWHHLLMSIDMTDAAKRFVYRDGALDVTTWTTYNSGGIGRASCFVSIGAQSNNGGSPFDGRVAEAALWLGTYLDISAAANREKFINRGKPVFMNADASAPTGAAPLVYMHLSPNAAASAAATNTGSAGDFDILKTSTHSAADPGAVTVGATTPSA